MRWWRVRGSSARDGYGEFDVDGKGFDEGWLLQDPGQRAILTHTVVHEAAHATTYLLEGTVGRLKFEGEWAPSKRSFAAETIDRVRLRTFWPLTDLQANALKAATPEELAAQGFMSAYAGGDAYEDIAEASNDRIVGSVFVREAFRFQAPIPVPQVFDPPLQFRFLLVD